jgi:hypothetical protein
MWRFKESEDGGGDICMAVAGFIFLESQISKEKTKRRFGVKPTFNIRKILNYTCLPYCTTELVNPCPQHFCEESHSAETSLQIVKYATKQIFYLYRSATGLGGVAENTKKLQMCFMNAAELLQVCRKVLSLVFLFLFCQFGVDPA